MRPRDAVRPLAIFAAARALLLVAVATATRVHPGLTFAAAFRSWDGAWYLDTGRYGYPRHLPSAGGHLTQSTAGFFPGFPLLVRLLHGLGLPWIGAGLVLATLGGAAFAVLLWLLVRHELDGPTADRAVALACFFPGALVFGLPYSESLALPLVVAALYALLRRWWVAAGLLAALAGATRLTAAVLVVCCAYEAVRAIADRRDWRSLAAPVLAPLGLVAHVAFLTHHTGRWDAYFRTQRDAWGEVVSATAVAHQLADMVSAHLRDVNLDITVLGTLVAIVLFVALLRSPLPPVLAIWTAGVLALSFVSANVGARPRFVLFAFPLLVAAAWWLRGTVHTATVAVLGGCLALYAVLVVSLIATP